MKEGLTPSKIDRLLEKIKPSPVVALVDDDPMTLELLERTLRDEGYEIRRFERAEDLLANYSKIKPDAIVMEVVLPGMSGLSVLDELRPKNPEEIVPVLILSKKDDLRAKLLAFRRGAFDYVTKPFQADEIAARVRALIRTRILHEMLEISSISDPLTSLYNKRIISIWLEREIDRSKRYGLDLSCLIVDFDHFHLINEKNGESFGDYVLREFGHLLAKCIRSSDIAGRMADDEFIVFLPATSKEQAMILARRLRRLAGDLVFEQNGKKASPSFSIGIVGCHAGEAPNSNILLQRAEEAIAKAKAVGLGQTAVLGMD